VPPQPCPRSHISSAAISVGADRRKDPPC
jgi:hypothetical protein